MALFREFAQDVAVIAHNPLCHGHFLRKIWISGGDPDAVGRFGDIERITHPRTEPRKQLLGQDNPGGIADFGDFDGHVHTGVITQAAL